MDTANRHLERSLALWRAVKAMNIDWTVTLSTMFFQRRCSKYCGTIKKSSSSTVSFHTGPMYSQSKCEGGC